MDKMGAALAWAARGYRVFPLVENDKTPVHDSAWHEVATSDAEAIRRMWTDPVLGTDKGYNIGVDCTGFVVVDIDVKNGKQGVAEYAALGGHYETLTIATPSGGYHCYFAGPDSANAPLSDGIDIRSHHGYVVAPGSTIDGRAYQIVKDGNVAQAPDAVLGRLRAPYARTPAGSEGLALDTPGAIQAARNFLSSAPVAIEGQRGDETTFVTAARLVREMALSVDVAYALMMEDWNTRCSPPWDADELHGKIQNAAEYGTADAGRLDPSLVFANVNVSPPPSAFEASALGFGNAMDPTQIPPRPWLMNRLLMRGETTLLLAPGSAGKSSLSLAVVAHLALGRSFGGYEVKAPCKSIVYNGEDSVAEQSRRLVAVCRQYELDYNLVKQSVMLLSTELIDMTLAVSEGRKPLANQAMVNQLVEIASAPDVGLIVYDPLVDVHELDETDNPQMNFIMRMLQAIARKADVANLILHHVSKGGSAKQEDRVGNMDIARGASAVVNKSRIAVTLLSASTSDCEQYGLQDHERMQWVRLDDAKMNLALANDNATWFRKEGVALGNGDTVGVLHMQELRRDATTLRTRLSGILVGNMELNNTATMTISQAVALIKAEEPLMANKSDADVKSRITGWFSGPVEYQGRTLHAVREEGKTTMLITLR